MELNTPGLECHMEFNLSTGVYAMQATKITAISAGYYDNTFHIESNKRIFAPIFDVTVDSDHIKWYYSTTVSGAELLHILCLFPVVDEY